MRRGVQRPERAEAFAAARVRPGAAGSTSAAGPGHYLPLLGDRRSAADAAPAMVERRPRRPPRRARRCRPTCCTCRSAGARSRACGRPRPTSTCPPPTCRWRWPTSTACSRSAAASSSPCSPRRRRRPPRRSPTRRRATTCPGRLFTWWEPEPPPHRGRGRRLRRRPPRPGAARADGDHPRIELTATARRALPDHVGAGMRLLCCGLNPSLHAADAGVGLRHRQQPLLAGAWPRPAWPPSTATRVRLLHHDRIGMTDLVKRATPGPTSCAPPSTARASSASTALCTWLRPQALAVVGLAGWRAGGRPQGRGRLAARAARPHARLRAPVHQRPQRRHLARRPRRPPPGRGRRPRRRRQLTASRAVHGTKPRKRRVEAATLDPWPVARRSSPPSVPPRIPRR